MVEEVPLFFELNDGVVGGPAEDGSEDATWVGEGAVRRVSHSIDDFVGVSGGVGEIVFAVIFVHPGAFEVAAFGVAGGYESTVFVQNLDFTGGFC